MRILVVEDEQKVADALREGLEDERYDVVVERTGEGAFFRVNTETFDVVLMRDDLRGLAEAIHLARHTVGIIRQSLGLALGMIAVLIVCTLLDVLTLPIAVVGHEGSTVLVILNGLRLMRLPSVTR